MSVDADALRRLDALAVDPTTSTPETAAEARRAMMDVVDSARPLPDVDEARRLVGGLSNAAYWLGATYEGSSDEHAVAERRLIFQHRDAARAALLAALGVADDDAGGEE